MKSEPASETIPHGDPFALFVLLKGYGADLGDGGGFVFYTNSRSRKGGELIANPHAALLFHWKSLRRQIRIEGPVDRVSDAEADAYFASRARDSQLGAVASDQSAPLDRRETFVARFAEAEARYAGGPVERPAHWYGFRLSPRAIEFWQDREHRLHERRRFIRDTAAPDGWASTLLYP